MSDDRIPTASQLKTNRTPTVYTAGYGDRGFPKFIELMKGLGATHLVDVRSVPQSSYWTDFRRPNLEVLVPETGLKYVWMGDTLGGVKDSPVLCKEPGKVPLEPLRETPEFQLGLDRLLAAAAQPERQLVLMCGCKCPHACHRSRLIAPALVERGATVLHFDADESLKDQAAVEAENCGYQSSLFALE